MLQGVYDDVDFDGKGGGKQLNMSKAKKEKSNKIKTECEQVQQGQENTKGLEMRDETELYAIG